MTCLETIAGKVDDEEVRIIHAIGVPTSISTAITRALKESRTPSPYINEPFNR